MLNPFTPENRSLDDFDERVMSPDDAWVVGFVHQIAEIGSENEIRKRLKKWTRGLDVKNVYARKQLVARFGHYFE